MGDDLERSTGVRRPPDGASTDELNRWYIACLFAMAVRHIPDHDQAMGWATTAALMDMRSRPGLRPHLEEAIGRKLTADELAAAGLGADAEPPPGSVLGLIAATQGGHG